MSSFPLFTRLLFGIYDLPRNRNSLTLTRSKKSLACLVLPRLVPRCCAPVGITSLSRVELVKLACAVMDPSAPLQAFASPKRMPRASISHAYACSLLCLLPWVSSWWVQTVLTPMPTSRRLPKRHTSGLTTPIPSGIALAMERKSTARWYYQCLKPCRDTPSTSTRLSTIPISCTPHTNEVSTEVRSTKRSSYKSTTSLSFVPTWSLPPSTITSPSNSTEEARRKPAHSPITVF
jgi:hypothetical protein